MTENEKSHSCSPKDKSNVNFNVLEQGNDPESNNIKQSPNSEQCLRSEFPVENLRKQIGKAWDALHGMSTFLDDFDKFILDLKGNASDGDLAAGADVNLVTESCINEKTIDKTNKSIKLAKRGEKSKKQPISSHSRLNKSNTKDSGNCLKNTANKILVNLEESNSVLNTDDAGGAREIDPEAEVFDEGVTSKGTANPTLSVNKTEVHGSDSRSKNQSENNGFIESSTNLVQESPFDMEEDSSWSTVTRKGRKKKVASTIKIISTSPAFSEKLEPRVSTNIEEKINEMVDNISRKFLENKTSDAEEKEKELDYELKMNVSINEKKTQLIEEYTKYLKTIIEKTRRNYYKTIECEKSGDFYQILNDWVLTFFPADASEEFIECFLDSSGNQTKHILTEPMATSRRNSPETIQQTNSDAMNRYLSNNTPKIKNDCVETFHSIDLNTTSFKSVNNSGSDNINENQIQASEKIILMSSSNIFRIIKEYENLISSTNAVKNKPNTTFFVTSRIYKKACLTYSTKILTACTQLKKRADNYYKILDKNSNVFCRNAYKGGNTKESNKYSNMLQNFGEKYELFTCESKLLLEVNKKFKKNSNETYLNGPLQSITDNIEPWSFMKNTRMLLKDCFKCIWHLRKLLKLDLHKYAYFMIDKFRLELNE